MRRATLLALLAVPGLLACSDDAEPSAATTTQPAASDLALRGDGLGVVDLGASPDDAISAVAGALGDPAVDSGWEPSSNVYGTCPGERIRGVEWGGLVLLFTDGDTDQGAGEHLFAWRVTAAPPAVATATGLGYGATAVDAEELYPDQVEVTSAEEPFPAFLTIEAEGGPITAYLDDTDTITNLEAGTPCGE